MTLDKLLELSEREGVRKFIEAEQRRIEPYTFEGDMQSGIKSDMKRWGLDTGLWPNSHYQDIVLAHAESRGWTQEGFTGMEIFE